MELVHESRPRLRPTHSLADTSRLRGRQVHPRYTTNSSTPISTVSSSGNINSLATPPPPIHSHSWNRSASTSSLRKLKKRSTTPHQGSDLMTHNNNDSPYNNILLHPHSNSNVLLTKLTPRSPSPSVSPQRNTDLSIDHNNIDSNLSSIISDDSTEAAPTDPEDVDENFVVDVLPSFEMYNALHRHIPQGNVDPDIHDFPPNYCEISDNNTINNRNNSSSGVFRSSIPLDTSGDNTTQHSLESTIDNLRPLTTQHLRINSSRSSNTMHTLNNDSDPNNIEDDLNDNDNIFIDKLYTLPKLPSPVEVVIKITKHVSLPPQKPEEESILKEYTSGDTIHGYCIIENKSSKPVKFEMFYVTLEGYTSVIDKQKGKRTVKRFLRMVDLSASWSYTNIDLGTGFRFIPGGVDFDSAVLGLNNNRILEPGTKYKKYFVFKLPKQLLDVTCKQEHFAHCLLPPSFGIDKYRNNCKYSGIRVNSVLGCGHLGSKGSPILTYDLVDDELSINYTVDARIVGKDVKTQKLSIMKEREYNIRFIPFGFHSSLIGERDPSSQLKDLNALIEERLAALKKVFKRLNNNEPVHNSDIHGTDLVGTIDDNTELNSDELLSRKLDQLHVKNRDDYAGTGTQRLSDIKTFADTSGVVESELNYRIKGKSSSKIGLFSGFRSSTASPVSSSSSTKSSSTDLKSKKSDKSGIILVATKIPKNALQYWSPSLLRKTNKFESKSKHSQENWIRLLESLPEDEKQPLTNMKINLTCIQSNNSLEHEPPEIQSISTDLVVVTAKSENSIPIKLNAQLLLNTDKVSTIGQRFTKYLKNIDEYHNEFHSNMEKLNELYNINRISNGSERQLKFTDFIPNQIYSNVESLANLKVKTQILNGVFKKQLDTLKDELNDGTAISSHFDSPHASKLGNAKGGLTISTSYNSRNNVSTRYTEQIVRKWVKKAPSHYEREVNINLEYAKNIIETLVPSFESCLCCRFYCVRINFKFHHAGSISIDVPIVVKNFEA